MTSVRGRKSEARRERQRQRMTLFIYEMTSNWEKETERERERERLRETENDIVYLWDDIQLREGDREAQREREKESERERKHRERERKKNRERQRVGERKIIFSFRVQRSTKSQSTLYNFFPFPPCGPKFGSWALGDNPSLQSVFWQAKDKGCCWDEINKEPAVFVEFACVSSIYVLEKWTTGFFENWGSC